MNTLIQKTSFLRKKKKFFLRERVREWGEGRVEGEGKRES